MTTIALSLSLSLRAPVVPSIDFQDVGHSSDRPPANKPNQEQDVPNCRATFAYRFVAKLDHPSNRAADYYPSSMNGNRSNNRLHYFHPTRYFPSRFLPARSNVTNVPPLRSRVLENVIHMSVSVTRERGIIVVISFKLSGESEF